MVVVAKPVDPDGAGPCGSLRDSDVGTWGIMRVH